MDISFSITRRIIPLRATILILALIAGGAPGAVYHAAKTGNDANAGTSASPFLTINKAAQVAQPGDSVIVHAGEYREWVQPARGGTGENARIVYTVARGEKVMIKGSERITNWTSQGNGVWKADVADNMFGNYHPYTMNILGRYPNTGEWLFGGRWCHLGDVFIDGQICLEKQTLAETQSTQKTWYASHSGTTTSIYTNFGTNNPNTQLAEILVRESVFGNPSASTGIDYITVDGFSMSQSAEEWTPYYLRTPLVSHAVIFVSGSYWIIQNCLVTNAKMRGISIDGPNSATPKNHIVRNNIVVNVGVSGIGGDYSDGSIVSGNWTSEIHGDRAYWGAEHAGIKIHRSYNLIISGNIVYNVKAPTDGNGIWFDWPNSGSRITGNVLCDISNESIRLEAPQSGSTLVDNNVMLTPPGFVPLISNEGLTLSRGHIVHNFVSYRDIGGVFSTYSNIVIGRPASFNWGPTDYNACLGGGSNPGTHGVIDNTPENFSFSVDTAAKTVTFNLSVGSPTISVACPVITTSYLSANASLGGPWNNSDGSSMTVDKDINNICRGNTPRVGPFQDLKSGANTYVLRPNSNFNFKAPCGAVAVHAPAARPFLGRMPDHNTLVFDMRGRLVKNASIRAIEQIGRLNGVYITISGSDRNIARTTSID